MVGITDPVAVHGAKRRELDVLGQKVEIPPVHPLDDIGVEQIARAGDGT